MGQNQTKPVSSEEEIAAKVLEDDEPDDWDKRIFSTGCAKEQTNMNDCYFEKKDWRLSRMVFVPRPNQKYQTPLESFKKNIVGVSNADTAGQMVAFKECWKRKGNDQRTETKDA